MKKCKKCSTENKEEAVFCKACGNSLVPKILKCNNCGNDLEEMDKFCNKCGTEINPERGTAINQSVTDVRKKIFHHSSYVLVLLFALIMFGLSFGTAVKYETAIPVDGYNRLTVNQSSIRIYSSVPDLLFNDQTTLSEKLANRSEDLFAELNIDQSNPSVQDIERIYGRLNMLSIEYIEREHNENQVTAFGITQMTLILIIQVSLLLIITLAAINYVKGKPLKRILPLFVLVSVLGLSFGRAQISTYFGSPSLGTSFTIIIVLGFITFMLVSITSKLKDADTVANGCKQLFTLSKSFRYVAIVSIVIVLFLFSGALMKTTVNLENDSNTSAIIESHDFNAAIQYDHDDFTRFQAGEFESELESSIYMLGVENTSPNRRLATEGFPWHTLFGGKIFVSENIQQLIIISTVVLTMLTSTIVIMNIFFLFIKEKLFKTQLTLTIIQFILLILMAVLVITWSLSINNYFDVSNSLVSVRIAIPLIFAIIFSLVQFIFLILSKSYRYKAI